MVVVMLRECAIIFDKSSLSVLPFYSYYFNAISNLNHLKP